MPHKLTYQHIHTHTHTGSGTFASRTWLFDGNSAILEHDCMIGRRILYINGKIIYEATVFPDRSFEVTFKIGSGVGSVAVTNVHSELAIYYTLKWKGKDVVSKLFEHSADTSKSLDGDYDVTVASASTRGDVTMYKVAVKDKETGQSQVIEKRFSEFVELHQKVWSSYAGSHLLSNVPAPPSRKWKLFTNHKSPQFIEKRRVGLHKFLSKLIQIPRIAQNFYVAQFLELDTPLTRGTGVAAALVGVAKPGEPPVVPNGHIGVPLGSTTTSSNSTTAATTTSLHQETSKEDDSDVLASTAAPTTTEVDKGEEESASDWI
jgi:hypothetical protein